MIVDDPTTHAPVCSLEGKDFQERILWIAAINRQYLRKAHEDGLRLILDYDPGAKNDIEQMIERERICCSFLGFDLAADGDSVVLTIEVPTSLQERAESLLEPFRPDSKAGSGTSCGGACDTPSPIEDVADNEPTTSRRWFGAKALTAATAVVACGACCLLPIALPAITLSSAGGLLAWIGGAFIWAKVVAIAAVLISWFYVYRQSARAKAKPAKATLWMMSGATVLLSAALFWPKIEAALVSVVNC